MSTEFTIRTLRPCTADEKKMLKTFGKTDPRIRIGKYQGRITVDLKEIKR